MNHTSPNSQNDLQSLSPLHSSHRVRRSVAMSNSTSGIERTARRLTSFEVWICRQWSGVYRCEFESLVLLCHISLNSRWIYFVSSVCLSCKLDFILFCCIRFVYPKSFDYMDSLVDKFSGKKKGTFVYLLVENIQEEKLPGLSRTCLYIILWEAKAVLTRRKRDTYIVLGSTLSTNQRPSWCVWFISMWTDRARLCTCRRGLPRDYGRH